MNRTRQRGTTGRTVFIYIRGDTTTPAGKALTGLAWNTAGLIISYTRLDLEGQPLAAPTVITLATLASVTAAWASGGFIELHATNAKGLYRLDLPDAAIAAGAAELLVSWQGANSVEDSCLLELPDYDSFAAAAVTDATIADAVWDEARSGHSTAGSFGEGIASVQGNVTGSVASVTGAVGSVTGAVGSVGANGITASSIAADAIGASELATDAVTEIVNALLAGIIEGTVTLKQSLQIQNALAASKLSGAGTATEILRDLADTKARVTYTVDASGNRTGVIISFD